VRRHKYVKTHEHGVLTREKHTYTQCEFNLTESKTDVDGLESLDILNHKIRDHGLLLLLLDVIAVSLVPVLRL
jgi:hypothetical protein